MSSSHRERVLTQQVALLFDLLTSRKVPTGFQDPSEVAMSMDGDTFQVTLTNGSYIFYSAGKKFRYTITKTTSLAAFDDGDLIFIHFNATGDLTATTTEWTYLTGVCFVAIVYKNTATADNYMVLWENHNKRFNILEHKFHHQTQGALYEEGGNATSIDVDALQVTSGEFHDEERSIEVAAVSDAVITIIYRDGAGEWLWEDGSAGRYYFEYDIGNGDINYDDNSGSLVNADRNKYLVFLIVWSTKDGGSLVCLQAQEQFQTEAAARLITIADFAMPEFFVEFVPLYLQILVNSASPATVDTLDIRGQNSLVGGVVVNGYTDAQARNALNSVIKTKSISGYYSLSWTGGPRRSDDINAVAVSFNIPLRLPAGTVITQIESNATSDDAWIKHDIEFYEIELTTGAETLKAADNNTDADNVILNAATVDAGVMPYTLLIGKTYYVRIALDADAAATDTRLYPIEVTYHE